MTMLPDIDESTYTDDAQAEFERKAKERQAPFGNFMQGIGDQLGQLASGAGQAIGGAASGFGSAIDAQRQQLEAAISQGAPTAQAPSAEVAAPPAPPQPAAAPPAAAPGALAPPAPDVEAQHQQLQQAISQYTPDLSQPAQDLGSTLDSQRQQLQAAIGQVGPMLQQANQPPFAQQPQPQAGGDLQNYARQAAQRAGVDPDIFVRQIQQESGFNPNAGSPAGARGIAQIVPQYHPGVDTSDPYASLDYAANLMRSNVSKYGGDYAKALAAYNAGPGAVQQYGGVPPFEETQRYVSNILGGARQAIGGAAQAIGQKISDISQFGDPQLSNDEAYAACGPAAAVRFAQRFGRNPTLREATDLASSVGWTSGQGMAGIGSEQALMSKLGVPTTLVQGPQWDRIAAEAQTGNPVTISTQGHYFYADSYNPQTGQFHVGRSGTDLRNGSEWMTAEQMTQAMGPVQGALLANNPTVDAPSTADRTFGAGDLFGQAIAGAKSAADQGLAALRGSVEQGVARGRSWADEQAKNLDQAVTAAGLAPTQTQTPMDISRPEAIYTPSETLRRQAAGQEDARLGLGPVGINIPGQIAAPFGLVGEVTQQLSPGTQLGRAYEGTFGSLRRDPEYMRIGEALNAAELRGDSATADVLRQQLQARFNEVMNQPNDVESVLQRAMASPDRETAEMVGQLITGGAALALAPQGAASGLGRLAGSLALDPGQAPFLGATEGLGRLAGLATRALGRGAPEAGEAASIVSRTGADVREGLYGPGEAGTMLPREQLPNYDLWESSGGRFSGAEGQGGYHPPAGDALSPLSPGTKGEQRIRQTVADLEWNPRFPHDLTDPDANQFAGDLRTLGQGLATGDWKPEQTVMAAILTKLSQGRSQVPVTKLFDVLGEEWVARHLPSMQAQGAVSGGKAASYGMVIRPEVLAAHIAGDPTSPPMMQLLTAIGRQALDEMPAGTPASAASFATRAERDAVIARNTDELFRLFAGGGQGGTRGDDVLMKGADIARTYNKGTPEQYTQVSTAASTGRQGWADTIPALHDKFLEWGSGTGRYAGLDDAAKKDLLLKDIQQAKVAGIGADKSTFVPNMGFAPDYATLDLRMRRQGFGLSPKAKLTAAERNLLEQKIIAANPEAEGGYVSQWLPWAYMTDEKTDYRSIPRAYAAVGDFVKRAEQTAQDQNRPLGEVVSQLAAREPRTPMELVQGAAGTTTRIGVSPQAVKALPPGTAGEDLYKAVPELRAFAKQAGVDFVEKPSIGTGLGFDPQGNPVRESDANLVVRGLEAANRWFAAAWLKANPNEASVMLAHTGPGVENATDSLGTIRLANGALDASVLARALTDFSPYGWHMTSKLNKAGQAMVTDLVIGGVEMDAATFTPRMQEFGKVLESEGFRLKSMNVEPARIEFLEQADVEGVLSGGPRGARPAAQGEAGGLAGEVGAGGPATGYGAERRAFAGPDTGRAGDNLDQLRGAAPAAQEPSGLGFLPGAARTLPRPLQGAIGGGIAGGYGASQEEGATPADIARGVATGIPLGIARSMLPGSALRTVGRLGAIAERTQGQGGIFDSPEVARLMDLAHGRGVDPAELLQREVTRLENVPAHLAESAAPRLENLRGALDELSRPAPRVAEPAAEAARPTAQAAEEVASTAPPSEAAREAAGNIKLSKYVPEEVRDIIATVYDTNPDVMEAARRGVVPDSVVKDLADMVTDGDVKRITNRWQPGDAKNAETIYALRQSLANEGQNVLTVQRALRRDPTSTDKRLALVQSLTRMQAVQEVVSGVTAEAGRAVRQFREPIEGESEMLRRLTKMAKAKGMTGEELAKHLAEVDLEDPAAAIKLAKDLNPASKWDKLTALWYFNLLSSPTTHLRNVTSNAVTAAMTPVESLGASVMDLPSRGLIKAIGGETTGRQRYGGEALADVVGMGAGIKGGLQRALTGLTEGPSPERVLSGEAAPEAWGGLAGKVIHAPGRALEAEDAFFKALNESAGGHRMAYRQAMQEGVRGPQEIGQRMAEIMKNPTPEFVEAMKQQGLYRTFQKESAMANRLVGLRMENPLMRYLMPFVRTPINITKYSLERSPLGFAGVAGDFLTSKGRAGLRARGSGDLADRLSRASIGSAVLGGLGMYAMNGDNMTGTAPTDPTERDAFYRQGKQPYSFKSPIDGKWYSYQPLQPYGPLFAAAANIAKAVKDDPKEGPRNSAGIAALAAVTAGQSLFDMPWTQGLADALDLFNGRGTAAQDPLKAVGDWAGRQAGGVVPAAALMRSLARAQDNKIRDPSNPFESMLAGIPYAQENVPVRLNAFGQPARRPTEGAEAVLNPFNTSTPTDSPVEQELARLNLRGYDVQPGFVGKSIDVAGEPVKLSDEERRSYQQTSGELSYAVLQALVGSNEWQSLDDKERTTVVDRVVSNVRDITRQAMTVTTPALFDKAVESAVMEARQRAASPAYNATPTAEAVAAGG